MKKTTANIVLNRIDSPFKSSNRQKTGIWINKMQALLLIAHGSRRRKSNDEVVALTEKLKATCGDQYQIFQAGFLEIAIPSIGTAIKNCVNKGATSITILPYFLNSGLHVIKDIPKEVATAQQQFPNIVIKTTLHIGASELMMPLLIDVANLVNQPKQR